MSVSAIILYLQNHFLLSLPLFDGETIVESLFPQHLMGEKMSKGGAVVVEGEDAGVPLHGIDHSTVQVMWDGTAAGAPEWTKALHREAAPKWWRNNTVSQSAACWISPCFNNSYFSMERFPVPCQLPFHDSQKYSCVSQRHFQWQETLCCQGSTNTLCLGKLDLSLVRGGGTLLLSGSRLLSPWFSVPPSALWLPKPPCSFASGSFSLTVICQAPHAHTWLLMDWRCLKFGLLILT